MKAFWFWIGVLRKKVGGGAPGHSVASDCGGIRPLSTTTAPPEAATTMETATAPETAMTDTCETTVGALEIPVAHTICHTTRSASQRGIAGGHPIRATNAALP